MSRAIYSKARIAGHPIHPMLVHFPIALYVGGLLALLTYLAVGTAFWYRAAYVAFLAGSVGGVFAAITGSIDLFAGIPKNTPAWSTGIKHMALNMVALVVFTATGLMMWSSLDVTEAGAVTELNVTLPMILSIVGTLILGVSGALGSKLSYKHHVGQEIDEAVDLDRLTVDTPRNPIAR